MNEMTPTPRPESLDMLTRLIGFDTVSHKSNRALIDYVVGYLRDHGVDSQLIPDPTGTKANLYAAIGPADRPGIMLSGHTDVVPVDGQDWQSDPFAAAIRDGRLYGRGSADMKGFIAVALAFVPEMRRRDLQIPIHFALSYDEEIGCIGARDMIRMIGALPVRPALCVVGEPTDMGVVTGHKGKISYRVTARGKTAHSSLAPDGVNAVEYAANLVAFIQGLARRSQESGTRDEAYDIQHTTLHTGVFVGGEALNIVPHSCYFDFEIRHLAEDDPYALLKEIRHYADEALEPAMRAVDPQAGFDWQEVTAVPGLDLAPDDDAVTLVKKLARQNDHAKVAFGTEAGLFQRDGGIATVICGPGSITQAHKPDEFIALEQLARAEHFMARLIDYAVDGA